MDIYEGIALDDALAAWLSDPHINHDIRTRRFVRVVDTGGHHMPLAFTVEQQFSMIRDGRWDIPYHVGLPYMKWDLTVLLEVSRRLSCRLVESQCTELASVFGSMLDDENYRTEDNRNHTNKSALLTHMVYGDCLTPWDTILCPMLQWYSHNDFCR